MQLREANDTKWVGCLWYTQSGRSANELLALATWNYGGGAEDGECDVCVVLLSMGGLGVGAAVEGAIRKE